MFEFAALTYGLLTSFVLSSMHANARRAQRTPPIMIAVGWFLFGVSATFAAVLFGTLLSRLLH
ncbi:MAG: hypothetical protein AB7U35_06975 [Sphingobium sp.]